MKMNSTTISLSVIGLSVVIYAGIVSPLAETVLKSRKSLADAEVRLCDIDRAIGQKDVVKARIDALEATNAKDRATWLAPMLGSSAMRAKSLVDVIASEAGLGPVEYEEGEFRALPLPGGRVPDRRTARRGVKLRTTGDYAAAVSFLLRVERDLPLATVAAFTMRSARTGTPDAQEVEIVLEWPCEGMVIR